MNKPINPFVIDHALYLRNRDNDAVHQWAETMFGEETADIPLADRVIKAARDAEAWFYGEERARAVEQVHLAEQQAAVAS